MRRARPVATDASAGSIEINARIAGSRPRKARPCPLRERIDVSQHPSSAEAAESDVSQPSAASDYALFLRKFLEKGRTISSAVPSSRTMAMKMLEEIDFSRPGVIMELGAGTGAVTEHIVERLRPHHRFVAVENDPDFVEILRRRFPTQTILQADATRLTEPLASFGVHRVKYVVSCLPTPALSKRGIVRLTRWAGRSLDPDGMFLQLTVVPLLYRRFYTRLFEQVNFRMVWRNIPPGGVYCCKLPRVKAADRQLAEAIS